MTWRDVIDWKGRYMEPEDVGRLTLEAGYEFCARDGHIWFCFLEDGKPSSRRTRLTVAALNRTFVMPG